MNSNEDALRAWVQARVDEHGSVDKAWPRDQFTSRAWRELCEHLGIAASKKAASLEEALKRLAELAG